MLAHSESKFNLHKNLTWGDVKVKIDSLVFVIKIPKNRNSKGEIVELFEIKGKSFCPVQAISRLKAVGGNLVAPKSPVFRFDSGLMLSLLTVNKLLYDLLYPVISDAVCGLSGHSFRVQFPLPWLTDLM